MTNRYYTRYNKIIQHYKNNMAEGYVEKHHILPLCMGGTNDIDNLVALPAKAHYICHYLLYKAYPKNKKLAHAFAMMGVNNKHQNRRMTGKLYELSKIARSNALTGIPRPEWVKEKLRKPKKSNVNYFGNTNAKGNKGKRLGKRSKEHTANLIASCRAYHDAKIKKTKERNQRVYEDWLKSGLSRKQYSIKFGINYGTLKGMLRYRTDSIPRF